MATTTQTILEQLVRENANSTAEVNLNRNRKSSISKVTLKEVPTEEQTPFPISSSIKSNNVMDQDFPLDIVWRNVIFFLYLHGAAVYGAVLLFSSQIMWQTIVWGIFLTYGTGLSITAGCHRLWCHKSYKATLPLRLILLTFQTIGFQNSVYEWCRDHRIHHKFSETNADPHNVNRGFFFAHMGWLMTKKHPAIKEKGPSVDMSDLASDPWLQFQRNYYVPLMFTFCFILPTIIPMYFWGETFSAAWFFASQLRFCLSLHATWLVNSAAHLWGSKPYNKDISPVENRFVSTFALGEGWHNYHHTFPWDYKTSELGNYTFNVTTAFIDGMAAIGWAYDLKTVDKQTVMKRIQRTGDGSHSQSSHHHDSKNGHPGPWGWGDVDIPAEDLQVTETIKSR